MDFDFEELSAVDRYRILASTIVPRPIAWVTTVSLVGVVNAAPFSFFNAMSKEPPILALGVQANTDGSIKDTARNSLDTGEFVVHLVSEAAALAMNATSVPAPPGVDELSLAGIATTPSLKVRPPRIFVSPVAFECCLHTSIELAPNHVLLLGRVVEAHVADEFVLDAERAQIDTAKLGLVGRMHGRDGYTRTRDVFQLTRPAGDAMATPNPGR